MNPEIDKLGIAAGIVAPNRGGVGLDSNEDSVMPPMHKIKERNQQLSRGFEV